MSLLKRLLAYCYLFEPEQFGFGFLQSVHLQVNSAQLYQSDEDNGEKYSYKYAGHASFGEIRK